MDWATWSTIAGICMLGAMSPGPSLAVVLKHTLSGGNRHGALAAVTHGLGIGLYALLCISGLAFLITTSPWLFNALQWGGAAYLAWLGVRGLTAKAGRPGDIPQAPPLTGAARDGFLIVFLNPKVAVFFIALFSQVIGAQTSLEEKAAYTLTAMVIDMGWYLLVAWLFSRPSWLPGLQRRAVWVERLFGLVLLALAIRLVWLTLG
jgi:threonine/homoserine/homoserine lactone efflux protein